MFLLSSALFLRFIRFFLPNKHKNRQNKCSAYSIDL